MTGAGIAVHRPRASRWLVHSTAAASLALMAGVASSPGQDAQGTGTVVGFVLMQEGGLPLGYSTVNVPSIARERFSNDQGVFVLAGLPPGPTRLLIRHLGYRPAVVDVTVRAGLTDTVRVLLARIAIRLLPMEVHAYAECKNPGIPVASGDTNFVILFEQLRQNAEQYRLLAGTYPFQYTLQRTFSQILVRGDSDVVGVDTLLIDSRLQWKYEPGAVLTSTPKNRSIVGATHRLNIPTIVHFADQTFLENHCFFNGGLETMNGDELLRIDLVASPHIDQPDVNGSIYLDPVSFQVRRTVLRLSRVPKELRGLLGTEAITVFAEALPSVPVIASITSINRVQDKPVRPRSIDMNHEAQRLLRIQFLNGRPGDDVRKP